MSQALGIVLQYAIHIVILLLEQKEFFRFPGFLRSLIRNHFYYVNYRGAQLLFKTSAASRLLQVLKWCLLAVILILGLPIVLIYQIVCTIPHTLQRVANQRSMLAKIGRLSEIKAVSRDEDTKVYVTPKATCKDPSNFLPPYQYRSLIHDDEIRLLEILPADTAQGEVHGLLRGRIIHVRLPQAPKYIALSYCWNDTQFISPSTLGLNPIMKIAEEGSLSLTHNLFDALCSARDRGYSIFWVDQICINQNDLIEKASQVAMMKDIYRHASQVLVWLGNDTPAKKGEEALAFADRLSQRINEKNLLNPETDFFLQTSMQPNDLGLPPLHEFLSEYLSLLILLNRPWFVRSWIVQEVSLNSQRRVLCGSTEVSFQCLLMALLICSKSVAFMGEFVSQEAMTAFKALIRSSAATGRETGTSSSRLLDVLVRHRGCQATLPADKVFAFLNIANDCETLRIHADYKICTRRVYIQTAVAILSYHQNLDILSAAKAWSDGPSKGLEIPDSPGPVRQPCPNTCPALGDTAHADYLPSWVPDWSIPNFAPSFRSRGEYDEYFGEYSAAGDSIPVVRFRNNETALGLDGQLLDRITEVGPVFTEDVYLRIGLHFSVLRSWEEICGAWDKRVYAPTGEDMLTAFCGTLTSGAAVLNERINPSDGTAKAKGEWFGEEATFTSQYRQLRIALRLNYILSLIWPKIAEHPIIYNILMMIGIFFNIGWETIATFCGREGTAQRVSPGVRYRIFASAHHRRFIRTEKGFIGLASLHVKEGDYVGLFSGGAVPLIIRKLDREVEEEKSWEIVSDAYVHGAMFGKCFDEHKCHTLWFV